MNVVKRIGQLSAAVAMVATGLMMATVTAAVQATPAAAAGCAIDPAHNAIKHVIVLGWDNFHFNRDNPNVPSDLEQLPAVRNFVTQNGTLMVNYHTPLISHTADDFLTGFTGVYPNKHGQPVTNGFGSYNTGSPTAIGGSSFAYWTDPLNVFNNGAVALASGGVDVTTLTGSQTITLQSTSFTPAGPTDQLIQTSNGYARIHYTSVNTSTKQLVGVSLVSGTGVLFTSAGLYPLGIDTTPHQVDQAGVTAPAPWVPFTRAGCDVGAISTANMVLENNGLDLATVFGPSSAEVNDASATANYVGLAIHCGSGTACSSDANARRDALSSEPGGYTGFNALFGHKYVAPFLGGTGTGNTTLNDVWSESSNGAALPACPGSQVTGFAGTCVPAPSAAGTLTQFAGFNSLTASRTLGYVAAMQEHNVPVTYAYLTDSHDCYTGNGETCTPSTGARGPGEAGYETYLNKQNQAFQQFFDRLSKDGINKSNTLFVFSTDESDRMGNAFGVTGAPASTQPTPAGCSGAAVDNVNNIVTPGNLCNTYSRGQFTAPQTGQLGEVGVNLSKIIAATSTSTLTGAFVENDSAPNFYLANSPPASDPTTNQFEQDLTKATYTNPYSGATESLANYVADNTMESVLHMVTSDPRRTPTVTAFGQPWDFVTKSSNCASIGQPAACSDSGFASIHGDYDPQPVRDVPAVSAMSANNGWVGWVGPGVANVTNNPDAIAGVDSTTWADETDLRPTLMALLGLTDDYTNDGRVMTQLLAGASGSIADPRVAPLGLMLKKLDAATSPGVDRPSAVATEFEGLAGDALVAFTNAVKTDAAGGSFTTSATSAMDAQLNTLGSQRDAVVADIQSLLAGAEFQGTTPDAARSSNDLTQGQCLLDAAHALATGASPNACGTTPLVPETPFPALLPLSAGALLLGALGYGALRRRRRLAQ